ncbi:isoaspartyl peptidase/L-asparaginase [Bacillus rossius redtenbacheri]|uniref:isoaspartyl peptidase/L-asparaginase n=1 Tax=Bacillus rossius redtenbacheri TaxID=93214 RepID=UPI002FDE21BE
MVRPVVLVHGGAGDIPDGRVEAKLSGMRSAAREGYAALAGTGSVLDAVQAAVRVMEDDPAFNAGRGSVLNIEGEVEMDAIIMEGTNLQAGAVGALRNVQHPVDVARLVMERTPHVLLVGEGAKGFATAAGVPDVPASALVTQASREALESYKRHRDRTLTETGGGGVGTVGAVAVDERGHVAFATSTGGTSGKMVGRVGDSPLIGSGGYADDAVGAVSTTGHGESIMKFCLAHYILTLMKQGRSAQEATAAACEEMTRRLSNTGGAITVSSKGDVGIAFTSKRMGWAYQVGDQVFAGVGPVDAVPRS